MLFVKCLIIYVLEQLASLAHSGAPCWLVWWFHESCTIANWKTNRLPILWVIVAWCRSLLGLCRVHTHTPRSWRNLSDLLSLQLKGSEIGKWFSVNILHYFPDMVKRLKFHPVSNIWCLGSQQDTLWTEFSAQCRIAIQTECLVQLKDNLQQGWGWRDQLVSWRSEIQLLLIVIKTPSMLSSLGH